MRQRLLTVGTQAWGGVLERLEGLVRLEALRKVLGGLRIEFVEAEAAKREETQVSAAADSREMGGQWRT